MKRQIKYSLFITISMFLLLNGCNKDDIMYYEGGGAVFFTKSIQNFSFMTNMEAEKDTMLVYVHLVGNPVDYDRPINIEVVNDSNTTATSSQYRILEGAKVAANDTFGNIYIEVYNPDFLDIDGKSLSVRIRIMENEYLKPGGFTDYFATTLRWTTDLVQPETWRAMRFFFTSKYSTNVYRAIIASTGLTEFWYYEPDPVTGYQLDQYEGWVYGKKFAEWIREYNESHDDVYRHDDGEYAGEEIVPIH